MPTLRLLLVDDSPWDAELLELELQRGGYELSLTRVESTAALAHALGAGEWDLVISDYSLPGMTALDALATYQSSRSTAPFMIVSGSVDPKRAAEACVSGARAFVEKGSPDILSVIQRVLAEVASERRPPSA